jgi:hypothetical protein
MDDFEKHTGLSFQSQRPRNVTAHKRLIADLIEKLQTLERQTRPVAGVDEAPNKDHAAYQALHFSQMLVDALAGWAIDHQVGLALHHLEFLPRFPQNTRSMPSYIDRKAAVDSHLHERLGTRRRGMTWADVAVTKRRQVVMNLLRGNAGAIPKPLASEIVEGLTSLSYGEVTPLFERAVAGRKVGRTVIALQCRALGFVEFRKATKLMTAYEAETVVADAYGVENVTVRKWGQRVRDELGDIAVAAEREFARNTASFIAPLARKERGRATSLMIEHQDYGDQALRAAGSLFSEKTATD